MHCFQPIDSKMVGDGPFAFEGGDNWALLTSEKDGKVNPMTISWGGTGHIWNKDVAFVFVRESRYTKEFIDASGEFSLSFFTPGTNKGLKKYCGSVSGRNEDKIAGARLGVNYDDGVPFIDEAENVLICRVLYKQLFEEGCFEVPEIVQQQYATGDYHWMYVAEITKVLAR